MANQGRQPGRGRVVRIPGLSAAAGLLELGPSHSTAVGRIPAVIVPRDEGLQRAVKPEGVVGLDPVGSQCVGGGVVSQLLSLPVFLPESAVVPFLARERG